MPEAMVEPDLECDPLDEIDFLYRVAPGLSDPAAAWIAWHERHALCWERIAAKHRVIVDNATLVARSHRRDIAELETNPDSRRARPGHVDLEPVGNHN